MRHRTTLAVLLLAGSSLHVGGLIQHSEAQVLTKRLLAPTGVLQGTDEQEMRWPVAVAAASASEIAVAEAHDPRLFLFQKEGETWALERAVPLPGTPVDLIFDGKRYLASLRKVSGLVAFEGPALLQRRIPLPRGLIPGALAIEPSGDLLVYDFASSNVVRISSAGSKTREVQIDGMVTAIAAAPAGGFMVAIARDASVQRFDADWNPAGSWTVPAKQPVPAWPTGLSVEPSGDILAVDRHSGRIIVLDGSGTPEGFGAGQGWEPGLLLYPAGIDRLADGRFVVADQGNARVQIFQRTDRATTQ